MSRLFVEIDNILEDRDDLTNEFVANSLGIKEVTLRSIRRGERNFTFYKLLKLSQIIDPSNPCAKINEWCLIFESTDCIKNSFEFAFATKNTKLLGELLAIHENSHGIVKECYSIYSIIFQALTKEIEYSQMIDELCKLKNIKDEPLLIVLNIYKLIRDLDNSKFGLAIDAGNDIAEKIKKISKGNLFYKECLTIRISEVLARIHLYFNNLEMARYYSWKVINADANPKTTSDAYYILGYSYLMNDEEMCFHYLNKSKEYIEKTEFDFLVEIPKYNLDLARFFLRQELSENADNSLQMANDFRQGLLSYEDIKEVIENNGDNDLIKYCEGIREGSISNLYKAYRELIAEANFYCASIIVKELLLAGENSEFVKSLESLKFNQNKGDVLFEEISSFSFGNCVGCRSGNAG
ncbi:AimR family lysis-lysogeny pheromone receptor [Bacillus gobiensis]|uniref:AimR family lysis-lysogeny pheromone receptor n=1 Tax=Bacillus gobiensis TaxID=1441095 RepID=UPI003D243773